MGIVHVAFLSTYCKKKKLPRCRQILYLRKFTGTYQYGRQAHEYSLQKKGPALYDHSLLGEDCAESGADDRLHIGARVSTPEILYPPSHSVLQTWFHNFILHVSRCPLRLCFPCKCAYY